MRKPPLTPEETAEAIALYEDGLSAEAIGKIFNRSRGAMYQFLRRRTLMRSNNEWRAATPPKATCLAPSCSSDAKTRGLCGKHAERRRLTGSLELRPKPTLEEDIRTRYVVTDDGCWEWQMGRSSNGYGRTGQNYAHRVTYELFRGPIPAGLELDHLCRNRACVNPEHLEAVTHRENARRGQAPMAIVHRENRCPRGHDFTPENTYTRKSGNRMCRECCRMREAKKTAIRSEQRRLARSGA